jgi:hypothetical protein
VRYLGNFFLTSAFRAFFGVPLSDALNGFKAFKRNIIENYREILVKREDNNDNDNVDVDVIFVISNLIGISISSNLSYARKTISGLAGFADSMAYLDNLTDFVESYLNL